MTEILTKAVWNGDTGETEIVPLSAEELAERELSIAAAEELRLEQEAAAEAKAAALASAITKLESQGLTAEEIAALRG